MYDVGTSHNVRPNQLCKIKDKKGQKPSPTQPHIFKSAVDNRLRPALDKWETDDLVLKISLDNITSSKPGEEEVVTDLAV